MNRNTSKNGPRKAISSKLERMMVKSIISLAMLVLLKLLIQQLVSSMKDVLLKLVTVVILVVEVSIAIKENANVRKSKIPFNLLACQAPNKKDVNTTILCAACIKKN